MEKAKKANSIKKSKSRLMYTLTNSLIDLQRKVLNSKRKLSNAIGKMSSGQA